MKLRLLAALAACASVVSGSSMWSAAPQSSHDVTLLEPGVVTQGVTNSAQPQRYHVVVPAGSFIRIIVEKETSRLRLTLVGPDGGTVRQAVAYANKSPRVLSYVAETSGSYELDVRLVDPGQRQGQGSNVPYELTLEERCPATERHREVAEAERLVDEAIENPDGALKGASIIETLEQARVLYKKGESLAGEATTLYNIALQSGKMGRYPQAIDAATRASDVFRLLGDQRSEARTLAYCSYAARFGGDYQLMLDAAEQALTLYRAVGDPVPGLLNAGEAFVGINDWDHAAEMNEQADALQDPRVVGGGNLRYAAKQRYKAGQKEKAIEDYEAAARRARALGREAGAIAALNAAVEIYAHLGQRQKALDYLNEVLAFWNVQPQEPDADTLLQLGIDFASLGDRQRAVRCLDRAFEVTTRTGHASMIRLASLGEAFGDAGQPMKAMRCFDAALTIARDDEHSPLEESRWLVRKAVVERDIGEFATALSHLEQALPVYEALRRTIASPELRSRFYATVQRFYELRIDLLMRLHEIEPLAGHAAAALQAAEQSSGRGLLEMLGEAGVNIREGVDPVLLEREQTLRRRIGVLAYRQQQLLPDGTKAAQEQADLGRELDLRTVEYEQIQGRIRSASPHYASLTQPNPLGVREIQQRVLDGDTLLLEYSLGETRSYLWAVSHDSLASFALPPGSDIENAARSVYELLTVRNRLSAGGSARDRRVRLDRARDRLSVAAEQLSAMILGPAVSLLGTKRLLIVAQGALQYIPFAALPDPAALGRDAVPTPLLAAHEVVHLPSASVLAQLRDETSSRRSAARALAVLADPVFGAGDSRVNRNGRGTGATRKSSTEAGRAAPGATTQAPDSAAALERSLVDVGAGSGGPLERLVFTRREANAIARGLPPGQALEALDFRASRETATSAELAQYRIVHFATHALIDSHNPALSGLVLSLVDEHGRARDGFLRLHDIYNLTLPADLIVMSACQTALGTQIRGEGLIGLTRGFMYAGAPRVVASLWRLDDRGTAELMAAFYRNMFGKGLRPAAALRAAQLDMSRKTRWQDPYFWAAFQLQGEWR